MSSPPVPPRFVPTLTEVIVPTLAPVPDVPASVPSAVLSAQLEAQLVQRVMQRVDLILERRLREVVGQLILEHTQTLVPRLRDEIGLAVSQSVRQAIEGEAASTLPRG